MKELVDLLNEYRAIADKESLYARVLMSFITERELRVRDELEKQIEAANVARESRERLRHLARTAPLERLHYTNRSVPGAGATSNSGTNHDDQLLARRSLRYGLCTSMLKDRLAATEQRLKELKENRMVTDKARRQAHKQSREDRDRKVMLVGEAVLRRVERGEWDEADFRQMMDEALGRPADRSLFDLKWLINQGCASVTQSMVFTAMGTTGRSSLSQLHR